MTLLRLFPLPLSVVSLLLSLFVLRSYRKTAESYRKTIETYKRALEADKQLIDSQDKLIEALIRKSAPAQGQQSARQN